VFLDADDEFNSLALYKLLKYINLTKDVDMVVSPLEVINEFSAHKNKFYKSEEPYIKIIKDEIENEMSDLMDASLLSMFTNYSPCGKIYKKSFLEASKIRFSVNTNYEDNIFVIQSYVDADSILILNEPTYTYRRFKKDFGKTQSTSFSEKALLQQKYEFIFNELKTLPNAKSPFFQDLNHILNQINLQSTLTIENKVLEKIFESKFEEAINILNKTNI